MSVGQTPCTARGLITSLLLSSCVYPHMSVVPDAGAGASGTSGAKSSSGRGGVSGSAAVAGIGGAAGTNAHGGDIAWAGAAGVAGGTGSFSGATSAGSTGMSGSSSSAGSPAIGSAGMQTAGGSLLGGSANAGSSSGGSFGPGGTSTGGTSTGGNATGGNATGGNATGGNSSGGAAGAPIRCLSASSSTPGIAPPGSRSCAGANGSECHGESCCTAIVVPGGSFPMGRSLATDGTDYYVNPEGSDPQELPEHTATVATFTLDKYEVTVGRFRRFVSSYNEWHGTGGNPVSHAGVDPIVTNLGWGESWTASTADLPSDEAALRDTVRGCYGTTFTANPGGNELVPINCVNWYIAQAFCIWDGGRLPTEAEWEYAAAGATLNRLYPWGAAAPDSTLAVYAPVGLPDTPVGSKPLGAGCFGHLDLAGSMWEWQFDWYKGTFYGVGAPAPCNNCVNYLESEQRAIRGGGWSAGINPLRPANRWQAPPLTVSYELGIRCARRL